MPPVNRLTSLLPVSRVPLVAYVPQLAIELEEPRAAVMSRLDVLARQDWLWTAARPGVGAGHVGTSRSAGSDASTNQSLGAFEKACIGYISWIGQSFQMPVPSYVGVTWR